MKERGFTIIEVSIGTLFIAAVLLLLAGTTTHIMRSYNKGIWLSQINQAGQQLNADIGDKARYSTKASVTLNRRMCINGITYVWNTQKDIDEGKAGNNVMADTNTPVRLVRIKDDAGYYCTETGHTDKIPNDGNTQVLLSKGVVVQEFNVKQYADSDDAKVPLLRVQSAFSTTGANPPVKATPTGEKDSTGRPKYTVSTDDSSGQWLCGEWTDSNNNKKADNGDEFIPAENQFCAVGSYDITVYERTQQI